MRADQAASVTNTVRGFGTRPPVGDMGGSVSMCANVSLLATKLTEEPSSELRWYAVYTRSRHEKTISDAIQEKKIEAFLPLYEVVRRWRNGNHRLQLPLFPSYSFVRISLRDQLHVLRVPGVVRLVGFAGAPIALPDDQIEDMRRALSQGLQAKPHPYLAVGRRVRITGGPFAGLQGILRERRGALRVIISIEMIQRSISVELPVEYLVPGVGCVGGCQELHGK